MDNKFILAKEIAGDLRIRRDNDETNSNYVARIIYSALGIWIRTVTLDREVLFDSENERGVSKIHINNSCKPFFENMINLYPEVKEWFYEVENPIALVRERLINSGELVDIGFNNNVILPILSQCKLNTDIDVIRGLEKGKFKTSTGLSQLKYDGSLKFNIDDVFNFYNIRNENCCDILKNDIKVHNWTVTKKEDYEVFNKLSKKSFYNCWENNADLKEGDFTIYREGQYGYYNFGFIKMVNGTVLKSQISNFLIMKKEVRRYMYALKSEVNNPVNAEYKINFDKQLVELKLYNALPEKEENILLLLGWPKNNIIDKFNIIFHYYCWEFIKKVLENLNIELGEIYE